MVRTTHSIAVALLAWCAAGTATATDVRVVGVFATKAVLVIDGAAPRTVAIGQTTPQGVKLVAIDGDAATLEIDGKRRSLKVGAVNIPPTAASRSSVTLTADTRGHFVADGRINGAGIRFLVDTGATLIALPAADARRLGIDYLNAPRGMVSTANGTTPAWRVKLDEVSLGGVAVNNVDAVVIEQGLPIALLGMSFLNRMEMRRDGETMVLTKRF